MDFTVRECGSADLDGLLALYPHLHPEAPPTQERAEAAWSAILADPNHHILAVEEEGRIVSSCVLVVIPNLTRDARPYGLIENVVTHPDYRGAGRASAVLRRAVALAHESGCYKVMLLTGRKDAATLGFYRAAGFNAEDKTAFIQWL